MLYTLFSVHEKKSVYYSFTLHSRVLNFILNSILRSLHVTIQLELVTFQKDLIEILSACAVVRGFFLDIKNGYCCRSVVEQCMLQHFLVLVQKCYRKKYSLAFMSVHLIILSQCVSNDFKHFKQHFKIYAMFFLFLKTKLLLKCCRIYTVSMLQHCFLFKKIFVHYSFTMHSSVLKIVLNRILRSLHGNPTRPCYPSQIFKRNVVYIVLRLLYEPMLYAFYLEIKYILLYKNVYLSNCECPSKDLPTMCFQ